ncbi:MAG: DUF5916 domain-containing protein [Bacteroidales bacterium]
MKFKLLVIVPVLLLVTKITTGQVKSYHTVKLTDQAPSIDGVFDDNAWNLAEWDGNFVQFQPDNGGLASQQTQFKILFDDDNIYVAIKALDTEPSEINRRLTRRDKFDGDLVGIMFDSYYDKRTSFYFIVNAAGVKSDALQTEDNGDMTDDSWDPIWYVKTSIDGEGWNAEMKIPLSQLRFSNNNQKKWGLEVARLEFRKNELSMWQNIPKESSGWTSLYGELTGIENIKPKRQVEIAPYVVGKLDKYPKEDENPYKTGTDFGGSVGVDGKIGITNNMILDFTINPDFGQVEADPSEMNLTAFETYFQEKRPFFIEGSNITDYKVTPGNGHPFANDNLFYSRRIGRYPQGEPDYADTEYVQMPENTKILGAFKLTGKTKSGWSYGIIENVTNKEKAEITDNVDTWTDVVEPFSNYFISRVQKDINKGNTIIGGMFTSTNRNLDDTGLDYLNKNAISGGIDFEQYFKEKKYFISLKLLASKISGTEEAILDQQLSSRRYFQRPDADYLEVDSTKTTLSGTGGTLLFGKQGNGGFQFLFNATWRSPGLELNDVGFLRQADGIMQFLWLGYSTMKPFSIFRRINVGINQWAGWDFGGTNLYNGLNFEAYSEFKNLWTIALGGFRDFEQISNTMLWGGPSMRMPGAWHYFTEISSDQTKKFYADISLGQDFGDENSMKGFQTELSLTYRPSDFISFSLMPSFNINNSELQYIEEESFNNEARYIFGTLDQKTFALTVRIDLNITPDLTLQYYGAPFISAGDYSELKKITDSHADDYKSRFYTFSGNEISYDSENNLYNIFESGGAEPDYFVDNPNFNFKEFRSNLVLRWEYTPGSLIYVVWAQGKNQFDSYGNFDYLHDMKNLFSQAGGNTFLIKISHRFRVK